MVSGRLLIRFSKSFHQKMQDLVNKGYSANEAKANFIVHWMNQDSSREIKIILPELSFTKTLPLK